MFPLGSPEIRKDSMVGYIFVSSWEVDRSRVRFGFSSNIKLSLDSLSEADWQQLVVQKIVAGVKEQPCWMR